MIVWCLICRRNCLGSSQRQRPRAWTDQCALFSFVLGVGTFQLFSLLHQVCLRYLKCCSSNRHQVGGRECHAMYNYYHKPICCDDCSIVVIIITPFHSTIITSPSPTVLVDQSPNVDRGGRSMYTVMSLSDTLIARHPVGGTGVLSTAEPPPTWHRPPRHVGEGAVLTPPDS